LTAPDVLWNMLALVPYLLALVALVLGALYFGRASKTFAEEV
jgi:ABC-type polysaccharide/polyol phosphate export permease